MHSYAEGPWVGPLTGVLFGLTYLALAAGRAPRSRIDRAGIATVGAAAVLAAGSLSAREAARSVDYRTLVLLFGMMVVAGVLRMSGAFRLAADRLLAWRLGPRALLAVVVGLSGVLSALLVNDVVCVAFTPLVLDVCRRLRRPPLPYLVALATASNVGSVATLTGNPQNMIIGSMSGISYARFLARLGPIAALGLVLTYLVVARVYRSRLDAPDEAGPVGASPSPGPARGRVHRRRLRTAGAVFAGMVVLFFAGVPIDLVALGGAALLLLAGGFRSEKAFRQVDWPLLVLFAGLFVVVRAFEVQVVRPWGLARHGLPGGHPIVVLSGLSAALSNLVSNVPAVLLFRPILAPLPDPEPAWLALAMSSTLAGNLTVLGSVANLIVVETARRSGLELGFVEYLKVGVPLTVLSLVLGVGWLVLVVY
jgi:Na+/H+ antiporter NhaD/arsenite permease-like protein